MMMKTLSTAAFLRHCCRALLVVVLASSSCVSMVGAADVVLVDFASSESVDETTVIDDPVMGGQSHSYVLKGEDRVIWQGETKIVDFLDAPGFCMLETKGDFSVLGKEHTVGIGFRIDNAKSEFMHPMGLALQNGYKKHGFEVVYLADARERLSDDGQMLELYALWTDFVADAHGQDVPDAPDLDPEHLSTIHVVGLTTYNSHEVGPFSVEILSIVGLE
eukprot:CAMPEP_0118711076 /NCGR_PEP_ID=MMETSP0800-20121206/23829_1 /TAXON_ID=210618 ORGANISM="Striatella unipunctata, Strain CCMP2910" /NCGR_SAMPLE_ID=MMETSP0800 /ASSEMBLY_ACC=CAM_ASM_000638 /LENGTH=218 /DNA_ID=CAMNT_0006615515 /DNA_START=108 /DNA_END=764 /DNA_ORIENTATION=+